MSLGLPFSVGGCGCNDLEGSNNLISSRRSGLAHYFRGIFVVSSFLPPIN